MLICSCFYSVLWDNNFTFLPEGLFDNLINLKFMWVNTSLSGFSKKIERLSLDQSAQIKVTTIGLKLNNGEDKSTYWRQISLFSHLKQSFFIESKNDDDQQHPAVILVAFYFNGYFFCGVICALMRSFRIFTLHIPTVQLACKLTKWLLFLYSRTFPEK